MDKNFQVVFTSNKKAELLEVEMPKINDDEVLIKTEVSQISTGTELTMLEANVEKDSCWARSIKYPIYPGYSNIGTIINIGKNVEPSYLGRRILSCGNHVKYFKMSGNENFIFVPDSVASDEAVFGIISQITSGSIRVSDIRLGDAVVVFGCGLIGQFVSRFSKLAGATKIFTVDISDFRLNKIPDDPCFIKINSSNENIIDVIKKYNNNELARIVFETTAAPSLIENELKCIRKNGKLIITSSPKGKSLVDFDYCSRMGITIIGAHNGRVHTPIETPKDPWTKVRDSQYYLELLDKKQLSVENMITHRESYKKAPDMYNILMEDRTRALAVHLYWGDE